MENADFCEELVRDAIRKHGRKARFVAAIMVNNLSSNDGMEEIDRILAGKKFLARDRVRIFNERNLKNRAWLVTKSRLAEIERIDSELSGKYGCRLSVGRSPRCGLIVMSFIQKLREIARKRWDRPFLFISFSEHEYEYKRVLLGIEAYRRMAGELNFIACHWRPGMVEGVASMAEK